MGACEVTLNLSSDSSVCSHDCIKCDWKQQENVIWGSDTERSYTETVTD